MEVKSFKEFIAKVIPNEAACSEYLQRKGLLVLQKTCLRAINKEEPENVCGGNLVKKLRPVKGNSIPTLRCQSCKTWKSVRSNNDFLY